MGRLSLAADAAYGTFPRAHCTAYTLIRIDLKPDKVFTLTGTTDFIIYMFEVFIPEVLHRGQYRVWSRLTEPAESSLFHGASNRLKVLEIVVCPLALRNFIKDIIELSCSDSATGHTFRRIPQHRIPGRIWLHR